MTTQKKKNCCAVTLVSKKLDNLLLSLSPLNWTIWIIHEGYFNGTIFYLQMLTLILRDISRYSSWINKVPGNSFSWCSTLFKWTYMEIINVGHFFFLQLMFSICLSPCMCSQAYVCLRISQVFLTTSLPTPLIVRIHILHRSKIPKIRILYISYVGWGLGERWLFVLY